MSSSPAVPQRSQLEQCLAKRDVEGMKQAIADGADVNMPFADGLTPLCRTAALGDKRILKLLIAAKADIDAAPRRAADGEEKQSEVAAQVVDAGFAALHWAAREDRTECARMLIEAGGSVDVRAADDVTPFMLACKMGHHDCARALKSCGADIEAANVRGGSAMVVACVMGEAETVRLLLSMRADPDAVTVALDDSDQPFQCRPLVTACRYDRPAVVSLLLGAGVSAESMAIAMTELDAFPSFVECAKLVRQAARRKEQSSKRRGGDKKGAAAAVSADEVARADAAMEALLAEEATAKPKPKQEDSKATQLGPKKAGKKAKGGGAGGGAGGAAGGGTTRVSAVPPTERVCPPRVERVSSSFSSVSALSEVTAGDEPFVMVAAVGPTTAAEAAPAGGATKSKRRKGKSKANKEAAAAWVDDEDEADIGAARRAAAAAAAEAEAEAEAEYSRNSPTAAEEHDEDEEMEAALLAVAKATRAMSRTMAAPMAHAPAATSVGLSREGSAGSSRRESKEQGGKDGAANMNAMYQEFAMYQNDGEYAPATEAAAAPAGEMRKEGGLHGRHSRDEDDDEEEYSAGRHGKSDGGGGGHLVVEVTSDLLETHLSSGSGLKSGDDCSESQSQTHDDLSSQQSDLEQLDVIMKSEKAEELDLFLHRKKFTTSAMSFFLSKIREDGPPGTPCTPGNGSTASSQEDDGREDGVGGREDGGGGYLAKPKLRFAAPPPPRERLPRAQAWTIPSTSAIDEDERKRRKARRAPPPPGFLPTSKYHELERRLREELHHAKEREEALQEALARALSQAEAS